MPPTEVSELVVSITPDGIDETTEDLTEMTDRFAEAADEVKESTGVMERFSKKFRGAMKATVAGLAVAAAGLLSQVPIIGELFQGLVAIFRAVAIQLDQRLRPAIQPIVQGMFELAGAIAEGDWDRVRDMVTGFVEAFRSINWGQLFNQAVRGIQNFIQSANLQPLIDGLFKGLNNFAGFAAKKLAGFLLTTIKMIPGGEAALELSQKFVDGLSTLVMFAQQATEKIRNFLRELSWEKIVDTISASLILVSDRLTQGLVSLVRAVNWSEVGGALKQEFLAAARRALGVGEGGPGTGPKKIAGTESAGFDVGGGGTGGGNGGMSRAEARGLFESEASAPGLGNSAVVTGGIDAEINLDGNRIGSAVKPFTVAGTLGRGRGIRFR